MAFNPIFIKNPDTGKPDETATIAFMVACAVIFRFLVDGNTFVLFGHTFGFVKMDAAIYLALLGPSLSAHAYIKGKKDGKDD